MKNTFGLQLKLRLKGSVETLRLGGSNAAGKLKLTAWSVCIFCQTTQGIFRLTRLRKFGLSVRHFRDVDWISYKTYKCDVSMATLSSGDGAVKKGE